MLTALVIIAMLALFGFLEWLIMIPFAGKKRMDAWKRFDPQGWSKFKMLMGLPFLAALIALGAFSGSVMDADGQKRTLMIVLMIAVTVVAFAGCNVLIALAIRKKGNEALEKLEKIEVEAQNAEAEAEQGPRHWTCPKCGARNEENERYCSVCSEHKPN